MTRSERIYLALSMREPVLTWLAIQMHRSDHVDPHRAGLRRVLRTVNAAKRVVRRIAPLN